MTVLYIVFAAVALGILVFIHELGHYFVARWTGMTVETFSIGFGRPLVKWRWNDVQWQLGWLPFGGFVKIAGMEFGKKEKGTYLEPYEIPNGFFSKPPIYRIFVALAGPLANFLFALLLFFVLWMAGGRDKPFSEFTQIIGWVDPQSELYANGVRPGDLLTEYDGKPFTNSKDLLYAAMLGDRKVELKGFHVNYSTGEKTPFVYQISTYQSPNSLEGILTTGITSTGRYLIYDRIQGEENPLPEGSPLERSGIQYGDRIVWMDGEVLFSMDQLSHLLNQSKALLTVKRGDHVFLSRQPRVLVSDLSIPTLVRNELIDWQYEAGLHGRWQDLRVLPYNLTADAIVENSMPFVDREAESEAFPFNLSSDLEKPLLKGDKILAIDAIPIATAYQLLDLIQTHSAVLIVQRDAEAITPISWKNEDRYFFQHLDMDSIQHLASTIGSLNQKAQEGYVLLNPVEPKRLDDFVLKPEYREALERQRAEKRKEIMALRDQGKRSQAMQLFEESQNKYLLGVSLQDLTVNYNPGPLKQFGNIIVETFQTLKALIMGYLNPKWISGPVGIVQVIHRGWQLGLGEALFWIAAISVNLGILNLLPIPVLDGGYICLSLYEMITRRRLKARTMERLIIPFVVLLIGLLIFLTFQDITRLF